MTVAKHPKRPAWLPLQSLPLVGTIQAVETRKMYNRDGDTYDALILTVKNIADDKMYKTRLNPVTTRQLANICRSPETDDWTGQAILVTSYVKGKRVYVAFAPRPVQHNPPTLLPAIKPEHQPVTPKKNESKPPELTEKTKAILAASAKLNASL